MPIHLCPSQHPQCFASLVSVSPSSYTVASTEIFTNPHTLHAKYRETKKRYRLLLKQRGVGFAPRHPIKIMIPATPFACAASCQGGRGDSLCSFWDYRLAPRIGIEKPPREITRNAHDRSPWFLGARIRQGPVNRKQCVLPARCGEGHN